MSQARVDLEHCDREPIHYIGAIQPHGSLMAIREADRTIGYASRNVADYFGKSIDDLLGTPLSDLIGDTNTANLFDLHLNVSEPHLLRPWIMKIEQPGGKSRGLEYLAHRANGLVVLESIDAIEAPGAVWEEEQLRQRVISQLIGPSALDELADVSARLIREITGFDRVMIYRFAADRHGEVIAESTNRDDSFLGLHYPASDIPDPARRHFLRNVIRYIPSLNAEAVPVVSEAGVVADAISDQPLDLTSALLRAVAPVHIEYLNNMGVLGSLSISLITNDALWGLVACHNYEPRYLSSSRLRFAELVGGTISTLMQSIENTTQLRKSIDAEKTAFAIERSARSGDQLADSVAASADTLMDLFQSQGMILSLGGKTRIFGVTPDHQVDFGQLHTFSKDGIAVTSELPSILQMEADSIRHASGAALLELSDDRTDTLIILREEFERTVNWAGKPQKIERHLDDGTVRLSPRGSFKLWSEERKGTSKPFDIADLEALRIIRRALFAINSLDRERAAVRAQKEAEAEQARLRHTLLEASRTSSLGELASALAHELNQPLAAVANYTNACRQEMKNMGIVIPDNVGKLIDLANVEASRAGDLVRRMRDLITDGRLARCETDLHATIRNSVDVALASSAPPLPVVAFDLADDIPPIWIDPIQIGQAVLNLARNSLAAMKMLPAPVLTITTALKQNEVEVTIADIGPGIPDQIMANLFQPFHESTSSGMGLGLSLCRTVVEAHGGRIWANRPAKGAEIIFSLPLNSDEGHGSD